MGCLLPMSEPLVRTVFSVRTTQLIEPCEIHGARISKEAVGVIRSLARPHMPSERIDCNFFADAARCRHGQHATLLHEENQTVS